MSFLYRPKTKAGDLIKLPQLFEKVLIGNGAWPTEGDANDYWSQFKSKLYNLYGWMAFLNMTYITCCELAYFIANMVDILQVVESFCTSMIAFFVVLRTLHFRLASRELKKLIKFFAKKIWINGERYPRKVQQCHRIMRPVFVYFILMFLVLILYAVIPIFVFYTTNQTMDSTDKLLPYSMIFPYDVQKDLFYVVSYISAVHAGYVIISHFYAHDAILLLFVSYLCGQFEILQGDIVRLIPECHAEWQQLYGVGTGHSDVVVNVTSAMPPEAERFKALQDIYAKRLHELSARHNDLISGSLLISCTEDTAHYLYLCNWEGGRLSKNSPLLLNPDDMDVTSLNAKLPSWKHIEYYPAGKDFCNKLRFMIMRSQRPVELNAMKFTVLSLAGFSKIISSSMSYFALLKTFLDKQN